MFSFPCIPSSMLHCLVVTSFPAASYAVPRSDRNMRPLEEAEDGQFYRVPAFVSTVC